ncbi:isochorismatase family protein [Hydrocarboniclastica marina]|uniref:Isochorismatase family protein n=1 Tax=Hydrocarboniclastica marina TaxID=2259620 RepID=A0A4V1D8A9_9ALTE|nr:isochorismatase family protein [Hydrocarboniclastica marina]QCF24550.1 isochorismatase family protein [Hydrocarboniclastica marina]
MALPDRLEPARAVLVIVDMQGRLAELMIEADSVKRETVRMIGGAALFGLPVLCVEQLPEKLGPTTASVAEALGSIERIPKQTFSAWREPVFNERLTATGRDQVLLAGMESHVCVYQTGMDLLASGYQLFPLTDCISSRHPGNRQLGVTRLQQAGAALNSVEMALFELQAEASGDRFRAMIDLIR